MASTITALLNKELQKYQKKEITLRFLEEYLQSHVGESFTIHDLRQIAPKGFSCPMAVQWLFNSSHCFGVVIKRDVKRVKCDPPIVLKNYINGSERVLDEHEVYVYIIERRI